MPEEPGFPPLHKYVLAHRCTKCGAQPGQPCDAPRKKAVVDSMNDVRTQVGQPPLETDPLRLVHTARVDAGSRHLDRDIAAAPWPEEREPGRRYDTLRQL